MKKSTGSHSSSKEFFAVKVVPHPCISEVEKEVLIRAVDLLVLVQLLHASRLWYVAVIAVVSNSCLCIKVFHYEDKTNNCISAYKDILYYEC